MEKAKFVLSKKVLFDSIEKLKNLGLNISYSYKTNKIVGDVLQNSKYKEIDFSIHLKEEINKIKNKERIWFFLQANSKKEIFSFFKKGINKYVIDNEQDLNNLLECSKEKNFKIRWAIRMKVQEHRIDTGKYFVYGMDSEQVNLLIFQLHKNPLIKEIGVHIHRKSQNTSEWDLLEEIKDSLTEESLKIINFVNIGGGLPWIYASVDKKIFEYIFFKIKEVQEWLNNFEIRTIIEPGRFLAAPCIKLITYVIQKQEKILVINTSLYQCELDTLLTNTKLLVEGEEIEEETKEESSKNELTKEFFLIKGNSPTRDDNFRYKVKLKKDISIGDKIIFLNAGAYNYSTDFFGYHKLKTEIKEDF